MGDELRSPPNFVPVPVHCEVVIISIYGTSMKCTFQVPLRLISLACIFKAIKDAVIDSTHKHFLKFGSDYTQKLLQGIVSQSPCPEP